MKLFCSDINLRRNKELNSYAIDYNWSVFIHSKIKPKADHV